MRLALLFLAACSSPPPDSDLPKGVLDNGWVATIVRDPTRFAAVVSPERREVWATFHRNDWSHVGEGASRRAAIEISRFHTVLSMASDQAWLGLARRWEAQPALPKGSLLPVFLWLAAADAGEQALAAAWRQRAGSLAPPDWTEPLAPPAGATGPLADRARVHATLRGGDLGPLGALLDGGTGPVVREEEAGTVRELWDPWIHHTLATVWAQRAKGLPEGTGLENVLFSDRLGGEGGAVDTDLSALGIALPAGPDDAEACRDVARALDAQLDGWETQLGDAAGDDGKALLHDLALIPATRSRALVTLAVEALQAQRPGCALAYAELARDHERGREITPLNSPTLYAVLATASLRTGHTREALDALAVLTPAWPDVTGLSETVGDLAVLEGIHRRGDSREN